MLHNVVVVLVPSVYDRNCTLFYFVFVCREVNGLLCWHLSGPDGAKRTGPTPLEQEE